MQPQIACLLPSNKEFEQNMIRLAKRLNLPIIKNSSQKKIDFLLYFDIQGLFLKQNDISNTIHVDFTTGHTHYRRFFGGGKNQAIAKAIGLKHNRKPFVLDATAGLGTDAFVLASLGCTVTLIERSPIISALLEDGLKRAAHHTETAEIIARMQLITTNSIAYMKQLSTNQKPDIVYLDPMFPKRKKKALSKKEMQILQTLLQDETDESILLKTALTCAKERVVVKRPRLAKSINNQKPDFIINGKSCRFDVYKIMEKTKI